MRPSPRSAILAAIGLGLILSAPARAACGAPFLISSVDPGDTELYSYIYSSGIDVGEGVNGSTISENIAGFFWAVGHGDVAPGVGADNGTFAAAAWMYTYPNYPALLLTTWAASTEIDTCVDVMGPLGERCMAMLLTDIDPETNRGSFALLSAEDDPASGDFSFARPGNLPIQLVPMAPMRVLGSSRGDNTSVDVIFGGPGEDALLPGAYLSNAPACQVGLTKSTDPFNGLIVGYKVYRQVLPRGSLPPQDLRREAWEDLGMGPVPLDAPVQVRVNCNGDQDGYFAYTLLFDGGFETPIVSITSTRIECGPNLADPEPRYRIRPPSRQAPQDRRR